MRTRVEYTLTSAGGFPVKELPLKLEVEEAQVAVTATDDCEHLALTVDIKVDRSGIRLASDAHVSDQTTGHLLETLEVDEVATTAVIANRVADSVSFITRVRLSLSRKTWYPKLIEEDDEDVALLDSLGTRVVASQFDGGTPGIGGPLPLVAENVAFLCDRAAGVRLYADALKMGTNAGRFCEFWRVLESGFGKTGKNLSERLANCDTAIEMEFTYDELEELRALRGRASHAQSRVAITEVVAVERAAARAVNRLQGLAEALILRKVNWGDQAPAVHPLPRPLPFVRKDGSIVLFASP